MHIYLQKLLYGGTENIIPDISILFFIKLVSQKAQLCEAIIGGYWGHFPSPKAVWSLQSTITQINNIIRWF